VDVMIFLQITHLYKPNQTKPLHIYYFKFKDFVMELSVIQNQSTNQVRAVEHAWFTSSGTSNRLGCGGFIDGTFVLLIESQYLSETWEKIGEICYSVFLPVIGW